MYESIRFDVIQNIWAGFNMENWGFALMRSRKNTIWVRLISIKLVRSRLTRYPLLQRKSRSPLISSQFHTSLSPVSIPALACLPTRPSQQVNQSVCRLQLGQAGRHNFSFAAATNVPTTSEKETRKKQYIPTCSSSFDHVFFFFSLVLILPNCRKQQ